MDKQLISLTILLCGISACSAQKPIDVDIPYQIQLPFSVDSGVPFVYWDETRANVVGSLTTDSLHNLYIIGGLPATLVKLTPQGKQLFRRKCQELQMEVGQIYPADGKIYVFYSGLGENDLYVLNAENGQIEKTLGKITEDTINSHWFRDGKLILHAFGPRAKGDIGINLKPLVFDLNGKFVGPAENPYNITAFDYTEESWKQLGGYLGKYKGAYLFDDWDVDNKKYVLTLVGGDGKRQAWGEIPEDVFGGMLYGEVGEFWSLQGDWISVLGEQGDHAIITTIRIDEYLKQP